VLFAIIFFMLITPLSAKMTTPTGVVLDTVDAAFPAYAAGLRPEMVITSVNDVPVVDSAAVNTELDKVPPGSSATIGTTSGVFTVITVQNPADAASSRGYLGVTLHTKREPVNSEQWFGVLVAIVSWIGSFFYWLFVLSLGIGLANLLPLGPVDGGRMLQTACRSFTGNDKRGDWWWKKISVVTLALILVLLLVPIGKAIFF